MFSIHNYKYDCSKQCKNIKHAKIINAALTKNTISDEKLASFVAKTCRNFAKISEEECTALHVASAANRCTIMKWLINHGANVNVQTKETGDTPLHKSLAHGNIEAAVLLLSYGAKIDIHNRFITDALLYCDDASKIYPMLNNKNEILIWGDNKHYNLGSVEGISQPQHLRFFDKLKISIKDVSIGIYHCLHLTTTGQLYAIGQGKGGRLGTGNENSTVEPKLIESPKKEIVAIQAAKDHSLILTKDHFVYSCGLNTNYQLGLRKNVEQQLTFKEVEFPLRNEKSNFQIVGISANDFYSIAYTSRDVFVWGLNSGQFGMKTESNHLVEPTKIPTFDYDITIFESSNSSIVFYSASNRKLVVYSKFKTKKIPTPDHQLIHNFSVNNDTVLTIAMCTEHGELYFWYEDLCQYVRCKMFVPMQLPITSVLWCGKNILINSKQRLYLGEVTLKNIPLPDSDEYQTVDFTKSLCNIKEVQIKLKRIPYIDRVTKMFYEDCGKSFVVLQEDSKRYLNIPLLPPDENSLSNLLMEASVADAVHDVVFHIDNHQYPAHKYVIYTKSEFLKNILKTAKSINIYLDNGITKEMFSIILKFIYLEVEPTIKDIETLQNAYTEFRNSSKYDKLGVGEQLIKDLGLQKKVKNHYSHKTSINSKVPVKFDRHTFPELHDVTVQCASNVELKAHKCILYARMEYFRMMFSSRWSETKIVHFHMVPVEYMETILDYLYTNDISAFQSESYSDNFMYNMIIICDQYFIDRLKNIFECLLIDKMSIKKCADVLTFALTYNCVRLENACLDYIIQNITRILEYRILEGLDKNVLAKIQQTYQEKFERGILSPLPNAVDDITLEQFVEHFSVDLDYKYMKKDKDPKTSQNTKKPNEKIQLKSLDLDDSNENTREFSKRDSIIQKEIHEITNQFHSQCNVWNKVTNDRKNVRNVATLNAAIKSDHNACESKFEPLNKRKSEPINVNRKSESVDLIQKENSCPKEYLLNFSELLLISSESGRTRNRNRKSTSFSENERRPKTISESSCTETPHLHDSFVEIIKSPQSSSNNNSFLASSPIADFPQLNTSNLFIDIVADQKRKRSYNDKIKTKSLYLTQIEETAICEFNEFYNIKEMHDEKITIERKSFV